MTSLPAPDGTRQSRTRHRWEIVYCARSGPYLWKCRRCGMHRRLYERKKLHSDGTTTEVLYRASGRQEWGGPYIHVPSCRGPEP